MVWSIAETPFFFQIVQRKGAMRFDIFILDEKERAKEICKYVIHNVIGIILRQGFGVLIQKQRIVVIAATKNCNYFLLLTLILCAFEFSKMPTTTNQIKQATTSLFDVNRHIETISK